MYKLVKDGKVLAQGTEQELLRLLHEYEQRDIIMGEYVDDSYDLIKVSKEEQLKDIAREFGFDSALINSIRIVFDPEYNLNPSKTGAFWYLLSLLGLYKEGTAGRFRPLANCIDLAAEVPVEVIAGTYLHELMHAQQCKTMGKFRYWMNLFLFRMVLEKDAMEIEDAYYDITNLRDRLEYLKKRNSK